MVRSARGIRPVVGDDIVLLIELAARGRFALVPEQSFLERRHPEQYSARGAGQAEWYSPGRTTDFAFPQTMLDVDCYRAVMPTPLSPADKARSLAVVTRT